MRQSSTLSSPSSPPSPSLHPFPPLPLFPPLQEARQQLARHKGQGGKGEGESIPKEALAAAAVLRSVGAPDVISYSTLIRALSTSPNPNAGRRAIALYREMREIFNIKPDRRLVDAILTAVVNSADEKRPFILGLGKDEKEERIAEVLADLRALGWADSEIEASELPARTALAATSGELSLTTVEARRRQERTQRRRGVQPDSAGGQRDIFAEKVSRCEHMMYVSTKYESLQTHR